MKIFEKMLIVFVLMFAIISSYSFVNVYGRMSPNPDGGSGGSSSGGIVNPNDYKPSSPDAGDKFISRADSILGVIQVIGSVVSVVALAAIGIKYMMGSAEEKAEYKKSMLPYIIGAVMVFAASNLVQMLYNWAQALGK